VAATITGLGSLWVMAEVPEAQAGWIVAGTSARLEFPSLPGRVVAGHVEYVYPELDRETRTLRARIVLDDAPAAVRPNMLSTVTLVGTPGPEVVSVPRSALIRTGSGDRVVIALGEGRFAPRPVVAGAESGDRIAITEGLAAGEQVVVAGQFLIDSEANLRAALGRLDAGAPGSGADPEHAGH
jgi:Cu(I)/Ag(I) efflux system membrane fusion protein